MASKCLDCGYPVAWNTQRSQYGRAIRRGLTPDQAKELMPLCGKCLTAALRKRGIGNRRSVKSVKSVVFESAHTDPHFSISTLLQDLKQTGVEKPCIRFSLTSLTSPISPASRRRRTREL
jgi:hypothetical protein